MRVSRRVMGVASLVTVVALGGSCVASPAASAPAPSSSPSLLAASVTLRGPVGTAATGLRLAFTAVPSGIPASTRTVLLQAKLGAGAWRTVATGTWPARGSVALAHTPTVAGAWTYRTVVAKAGALKAVTSAPVGVSVRASTSTLTMTGANGSWDSTLRFTATPVGNPLRAVDARSVRFDVRRNGGAWTLAGAVRSTTSGTPVVLRYTPRASGSYEMRATLAAAPGLPAASTTTSFVVRPWPTNPSSVGATVAAVAVGLNATQGRAVPEAIGGSIRLWDAGVSWLEIEQGNFHAADRPAVYDWTRLDAIVDDAVARGQSITYCFGMTPRRYAADDTIFSGLDPNLYWPGMAQPPTMDVTGNPDPTMSAFRAFARELAQRYAGRIDSYQVWNEANLPGFWQGTAEQMALMTQIVHEEVDAANVAQSANARVVAPSFVFRTVENFYPFASDYLGALKARSWVDVDVFSAHFYPAFLGTPTDVAKQIGLFQRLLRDFDAPALEVWNTEVNYLSNPTPAQAAVAPVPSDSDIRALVGQTMVRSFSAGVSRTFWYGWMPKADNLGLGFFDDAQAVTGLTVPAAALARMRSWLRGAQSIEGCTTNAAQLTVCKLNYANSHRWLVWSEKPNPATSSPFDALPVAITGLGVVRTARTLAGTSASKVGTSFYAVAEPLIVDSSL